MRTVAIDTSDGAGSLALLDDDQLLDSRCLARDRKTTQSLAVQLRDALAEHDWAPASIDLVAVARGPGSFTGIRVAVTTAKTLAYATGADIIAVDTLQVIAAAAPAECTQIWSVLDAHRGQVFAARYSRAEPGLATDLGLPAELSILHEMDEARVWDVDAWLARLAPGQWVTGPQLAKLVGRLPSHVTVVDDDCWSPQAAWVGRLAVADYRAGRRDDLWQLVPQYLRPSAAEEKAAEKAAEAAAEKAAGAATKKLQEKPDD